MNRFQRTVLIGVSLILAAASAYGVGRLATEGTPRTEAQIPVDDYGERTKREYEKVVATAEAERAKPVFRGVLGEFEIVADYEPTDPSKLCGEGNRPSRESGFSASELNQAKMTLQKVCADGSVVATWSESGNRRYFYEKPVLQLDAPKDNLELLTVDGHPALIARPLAGIGTHDIFVISRSASGTRPGILIWTWGESRGEAIDAAQEELEK